MPLPYAGVLNGNFLNLRLTSLEEFMTATKTLLPVYLVFIGVIGFLLLVLKLLGPTQGGKRKAQ